MEPAFISMVALMISDNKTVCPGVMGATQHGLGLAVLMLLVTNPVRNG